MIIENFLKNIELFDCNGNVIDFFERPYVLNTLDKLCNQNDVLINSSRQMGVTTILSIYASYFATIFPKSNIKWSGFNYNATNHISQYLQKILELDFCNNDFCKLKNGSIIWLREPKSSDKYCPDYFDLHILDNIDFHKKSFTYCSKTKYVASCTTGHNNSSTFDQFKQYCHPFDEILLPYSLVCKFDENWKSIVEEIIGETNFVEEYIVNSILDK